MRKSINNAELKSADIHKIRWSHNVHNSNNKPEGRSVERIPPTSTLTFQNLITLPSVAKGMTDEANVD